MRIGKVRFKWVNSWKDKKTGNVYTKYRPPGGKSVTLPNTIGSPEFVAAYAAAIRGEQLDVTAAAARKGTVKSTIERYIAECSAFNRLGKNTRQRQGSTLNRFSSERGDKPFAMLDRAGLDRIFASAKTPGIARTLLITLKPLFQWAVTEKLIAIDPSLGMKISLPSSDGHHTWTEEQIAQFEARWPIGTMERLALALLVHTGQRRSCVMRMGRHAIRDGVLVWQQIKKTRAGRQTVEIPVHPELAQAIAACTLSGHSTFLVRKSGKPFNERKFNEWFRDACTAADLGEVRPAWATQGVLSSSRRLGPLAAAHRRDLGPSHA
jgi:integrase